MFRKSLLCLLLVLALAACGKKAPAPLQSNPNTPTTIPNREAVDLLGYLDFSDPIDSTSDFSALGFDPNQICLMWVKGKTSGKQAVQFVPTACPSAASFASVVSFADFEMQIVAKGRAPLTNNPLYDLNYQGQKVGSFTELDSIGPDVVGLNGLCQIKSAAACTLTHSGSPNGNSANLHF